MSDSHNRQEEGETYQVNISICNLFHVFINYLSGDNNFDSSPNNCMHCSKRGRDVNCWTRKKTSLTYHYMWLKAVLEL